MLHSKANAPGMINPHPIYDTNNNRLLPVPRRTNDERFALLERVPPPMHIVPYFLRPPVGHLHRMVYVVPPPICPSTEVTSKVKRKPKRSKSQWKHISRRNKMAVLKYLMRKRKQQSEAKSVPMVAVPVEEQKPATPIDLIAPSLKVSFDANEQIDSISLYYHRKCPSVSRPPLKTSENKLDLLLEAVEYIETRKENVTFNIGQQQQ